MSAATWVGIRSVWVDRDRGPEDPSLASAVIPDLVDLPPVIASLLG